jgi:Tfp pilus assembly protein PilF
MVGQLAAADRHEASVELAETLLDHAISVLRQPQDFNRPDWDKDLRDEEKIYFPNSPLVPDRVHERMENLRLRLVSALFLGKDYRRASDLLNEWLEATNEPSTRFMYLRTLAGIQQAEGHEEAASGTMERALLLRPTDAGLNNDLSYTWIDRGIRLADAEPMIRYAVGRAPAHAAYLDTFGWLHYKKGNFEEAKKWLERANAARGEEDPVILDHLGDCAWRMGQKEQALARWNRSIEVLNQREGAELANADERRASRQTPKKVEDVAAGRTPEVAPLERTDQGEPGQPEQGKEQGKSGS